MLCICMYVYIAAGTHAKPAAVPSEWVKVSLKCRVLSGALSARAVALAKLEQRHLHNIGQFDSLQACIRTHHRNVITHECVCVCVLLLDLVILFFWLIYVHQRFTHIISCSRRVCRTTITMILYYIRLLCQHQEIWCSFCETMIRDDVCPVQSEPHHIYRIHQLLLYTYHLKKSLSNPGMVLHKRQYLLYICRGIYARPDWDLNGQFHRVIEQGRNGLILYIYVAPTQQL